MMNAGGLGLGGWAVDIVVGRVWVDKGFGWWEGSSDIEDFWTTRWGLYDAQG
jgi:hypothetical protein